MAGVNKVILVGNVGSDPDVRTLQSGSKVTSFSLATSENYTDRNGQKQENTEWHRIELWDTLANVAEQFVRKGSSVYVEGKIKSEKYTDANGIEKTSFKIRGTSLQLLGSKPPVESGSYTPPARTETPMQPMPPPPAAMQNNDSDDLPF